MRAEIKLLRQEVVGLRSTVQQQDQLLNGLSKAVPADGLDVGAYAAGYNYGDANQIVETYIEPQLEGVTGAALSGFADVGVASLGAAKSGYAKAAGWLEKLRRVFISAEEEELEPAEEVTLEESMWGIVLLIGTEPMGSFC